MLETFVFVVFLLFVLLVCLFEEADRERRDLLTDMCQLVHDGKVEEGDLRRCKDHAEIQERLKRREGR